MEFFTELLRKLMNWYGDYRYLFIVGNGIYFMQAKTVAINEIEISVFMYF
ncbi:MAG: hypothetical protein ACLRQF_03385 [Thomasclavelia ramosa]